MEQTHLTGRYDPQIRKGNCSYVIKYSETLQ